MRPNHIVFIVMDSCRFDSPETHFFVTADRGELFGEDGNFGHGPIMHPKCFEVLFVEGRVR